MSEGKPLISVGALAPRGGLVETRDASTLEARRGVVVQRGGDGPPLPTPSGRAAWNRHDESKAKTKTKNEERRDDAGKAQLRMAAPVPVATSRITPTIRPFAPSARDAQEDAMPRRKKQADDAASHVGKPKKRKWAGPTRAGEAKFGVFNDGSVQVDAPGCKGNLKPDEFRALIEFAKRIGVHP